MKGNAGESDRNRVPAAWLSAFNSSCRASHIPLGNHSLSCGAGTSGSSSGIGRRVWRVVRVLRWRQRRRPTRQRRNGEKMLKVFKSCQKSWRSFSDDDGQKMVRSGMPDVRIDLDQQTCRGRRNRCGFGQPSSCSSPRAVLEACHGPSPQCSASRLQRTAPAATTQSSAASSASARSVKSSSCRTWSRRARRG